MANYYLDTEFLEGPQDKRIFGFKYGETKPTIDLISIALVSDDGREYYAISKDFNLYDAWHRFDLKDTGKSDLPGINRSSEKVYWIRDNVLLPIYLEHIHGDTRNRVDFSYSSMKWILAKYGKSNQEIALDVLNFVHGYSDLGNWLGTTEDYYNGLKNTKPKSDPKFFAYYADYDWVVFCWLFGKMIDLPKGFPMYCVDLKQELDNKLLAFNKEVNFLVGGDTGLMSEGCHLIHTSSIGFNFSSLSLREKLDLLKKHNCLPKQSSNHNALADARWNKELHKFINNFLL